VQSLANWLEAAHLDLRSEMRVPELVLGLATIDTQPSYR